MKIRYMNDLYLEFDGHAVPDKLIGPRGEDLVVLAGAVLPG